MRGRSVLYTALIGATALVSGCANGKGPVRIGEYLLDADAQHISEAYFRASIRSDYERAFAHVLSIVDDGDKMIDHNEALDAIEMMRPYMRWFANEILQNIDGKAYAEKKARERMGPTIGELRGEVSSTD